MAERIVLVTGSTGGIGAGIATAFARDGATVWVNGRDATRTAEAAERIATTAGAGKVLPVAADVATADGADVLARTVPEVDVLVNNAAVYGVQPFAEISDEVWRSFFDMNVLAGIRLSRIYLPGMVSRGWGRIVFISSEVALNMPDGMMHYAVTKLAQMGAARGIAQEAGDTGVTANCIVAGPTSTEGNATMMAKIYGSGATSRQETERRYLAEFRPTSILQRFATVEEVAGMVRYIGSDAASATTGAAFRVDGGTVKEMA